jgi:ribose transport system substrate-binding protein
MVITAAVVVTLAAGCAPGGGGGRSGPLRIALLMKAKTNPFFQAMEDAAKQAAAELDVELIAMGIVRETDVGEQINQIENMIQQRADAILVTPADSKAIIPALLKAQRRGILVFNVDNRLDPATVRSGGLRVEAYIGADNEQGGYMVGTYLIETIRRTKPDQGPYQVAMLEGIRGVDNAEARKRGFRKAVEEAADVTIVDSQTANWDMEQGYSVFVNMLQAHDELDGLFCANDMMALGAIRAVQERKKVGEVLVAAYDNLEAARLELEKGTLVATLEQHPERMGDRAVREAVKALTSPPPDILVELELITAGGSER